MLKKVLISPLDWGLGHASRCIPLIRKLQAFSCEVILASSGDALTMLLSEFPDLYCISLPDSNIRYSSRLLTYPALLLQLPRLAQQLKRENEITRDIVRDHRIDAIISDNRYGVYHPGIPSVLMTHQLEIRSPLGHPLFKGLIRKLHAGLISRFDQCWIPDFPGSLNLSGALSHGFPLPENYHYIGPLSRFRPGRASPDNTAKTITVLLSGPEPQRSRLEAILLPQCRELGLPVSFIRGRPSTVDNLPANGKVKCYNYLSYSNLHSILQETDLVICRSGYSSVMDLFRLQKRALLIPTPAQSEQQYLAGYHREQGNFYSVSQSRLRLARDIPRSMDCFPGFRSEDVSLLDTALKNFIGI
ncbi:MAG TPA: glycosyltransferase [Bacteroidales bacterium]|nr:glycosyltransferase [Bacteroidales bacterium]HSA43390.1 glycosyltransferase [Bacteroidales bacterium]